MINLDYILGHAAYWLVIVLLMIGLYALLSQQNLLKKLAGLSIFQTAAILLYVSFGKLVGGTAPIVAEGFEQYANPLPQVLMLTAIVVGVATTALGYALVVRIKSAYGTIEQDRLDKKANKGDIWSN